MSMQTATPTKPQRPWWRRMLYRVGRVLVVAYVVATVLGWTMQEKLLFPGSWMSQGKAAAVVQPRAGEELVRLQAGGDEIVALWGAALERTGRPKAHPETCPTILYFYGNGMYLAQTQWEFAKFRELGANVLIPEFVGYGMSSGSPGEAGCYATAEAAYAYLLSRKDVDPKKIIVAGWSLGAAVACDTATKHDVAGLAMFSGFTSADDVAAHHYWFLPTGLLLRHHFRSIDKIGSVRVPVLIGHGINDSIVPYEMSLRLKAAAVAKDVKQFGVAGADHNDFFEMGGTEVMEGMRELVGKVGRL